jgi:IS30 family transposase
MGVPTYFCDPYWSFQRGTNEHFNGRIRRYLPKGTSFDDVTQEELDEYITEINNRPRKVLGWLTSAEVFQELCSKEAIT